MMGQHRDALKDAFSVIPGSERVDCNYCDSSNQNVANCINCGARLPKSNPVIVFNPDRCSPLTDPSLSPAVIEMNRRFPYWKIGKVQKDALQ